MLPVWDQTIQSSPRRGRPGYDFKTTLSYWCLLVIASMFCTLTNMPVSLQVCMTCIRCKSCSVTPGKTWDTDWNHDKGLCPDCSKLYDQGEARILTMMIRLHFVFILLTMMNCDVGKCIYFLSFILFVCFQVITVRSALSVTRTMTMTARWCSVAHVTTGCMPSVRI